MNIRTYLFVLKSSYERISRKKKGSSETRFETISYSHLASKFSFGKHPYQTLGRPKHPWALWNTLPKASPQRFNGFWSVVSFSTCLNISFGVNDETKDAKHQEKLAASVLKPTSSWKHVLFSSTKNILFPNKNTLLGKQINFSSASLNIGPQNFSGAHNSRAFFFLAKPREFAFALRQRPRLSPDKNVWFFMQTVMLSQSD